MNAAYPASTDFTGRPMSVLIVADNALSAEAIRREMRHTVACRIAGFVSTRREYTTAITQEDPDAIVVDESPDAETTLQILAAVRSAAPRAKIVLLTLESRPEILSAAATAGADAAIAKTVSPGSLGTLVREVVRGNVFHSFAPAAPELSLAERHPTLTRRELEILRLVAAGLSNGGVAARLCVTEQTVKFHLSNVYRKLGVANRTQASHLAHRDGLLDPPVRLSREIGAAIPLPQRPDPVRTAA